MQVERELVVRVKTSDGITLKPGDMVAMTARGYTYVGKYLGMSGRGALSFEGIKMDDVQPKFSVMPAGITKMYKCCLELIGTERGNEDDRGF